MRAPEVITFDCYGTLIDWETGIADAFEGAARAAGKALGGSSSFARRGAEGPLIDRATLIPAYVAAEHAVEAGPYRRYREVLAETARLVCARLGFTPADGGAFLPASLPSWRAFPDTNAALARLVDDGIGLGILSNVDDDLLAATRRHLDVPFELVITAAEVGSYKPAHGHFTAARARLGTRRWLHAAQSHLHDVTPCRALAIPIAWVNRHREVAPGGLTPDLDVSDLAGLADVLLAGGP